MRKITLAQSDGWYYRSMAKGIQMDIIGAVPIDMKSQMQVFAQTKSDPMAALHSNRRRMENMSVLERKEKLLDVIN